MPGNQDLAPRREDEITEPMPREEDTAPADREHVTRLARPAIVARRLPDQPMPGTRIGRYELIRLLGRGGMGEVHLARDLRLGRLVAIKRLATHGSGLSRRFLDEARATAHCHHDNIVVIHEVGEEDGHPYMVLEYLEGQTLRQWLNERAAAAPASCQYVPVPPGRAVELMISVVRALAYAHDQGIVHRDLKPENIMLTRSGTIKVLDFGIAKLLSTPVSPDELGTIGDAGHATFHASELSGTLPYMSPEQMNVGAIDHRSDVWAVGVMLFELVTGRHPVPSRAIGELMRVTSEDEPMPSVGECMPDLGPLAAIIDRCLLKHPQHRTASARVLLAELEALSPGRGSVPVGDDGNPFAGLATFQEGDADRFFGRDRDIRYVVTKLRSRPLVAVVGPSGTGSSSLIRAGVIPALKRSGEAWDAYVVRPGRAPLATLAALLEQIPNPARAITGDLEPGATPRDTAARAVLHPVINRLRAEPGYLGARLRARAASKLRRIVLFVDQFEELYTLGAPPDERAAFLAALAAVADDAASPLRVIVCLRSDFLDRLAENSQLGAEFTRGMVLLAPMGREGLREALIRPAELCEFRFEPPTLVDRMVDALDATPGALPLLQFIAAQLWELRDRDRRLLTEASYEELGGVAGALASHADAVLAGMPARDARLARTLFLRLVTPERTRGIATLTELRQIGRTPEDMDRVLARLIDARLLAVESGTREMATGIRNEDDGVVEIVHESLIDTWPLLARWLDENEADAVFLARLRSAAVDWERSGHATGLLWSGEAAREARSWRHRHHEELAPAEKHYLDAMLAAAERSRRRLFGGALAMVTVMAMTVVFLAHQQHKANEAAARAQQQAELAEQATQRAEQETQRTERAKKEAEQAAMRARDSTRMMAMRALPEDPTTQLALLREIEATSAPPPGAVGEAKRLLHARVASAILTGHSDTVWSVSFSPNGARIVTASADKTVRVWEADGTSKIVGKHDDEVYSASFSPDGARIVSASKDKEVRIWWLDGPSEPRRLLGHTEAVWSAAFNPDGTRIVSASSDRTVRVWNADGRGDPLILHGHADWVRSAAFSPDGQNIVSASLDKTVRVWRVDGTGKTMTLRGHEYEVLSAAFSPDGRRIVSTSLDKTVRVWDAKRRATPLVLRGHDDIVMSAAFSPDSQRIVSASGDKTVMVWNTDERGEPLVLRGHDQGVVSVAFSLDGRIASASLDKAVRVWNADGTDEPLILRGHGPAATSVKLSSDGKSIVSASMDKMVRVWSADGRGDPLVLRGHGDRVMSASFSRDGQRIVSASRDTTVRIWNADGRGKPLVLDGHGGAVEWASFNSDGTRIVSASWDKTVRVWNADGTGEPLVLRGHEDAVWSAAFSPDGKRIASASWDKTVRVWNADGTDVPLVLRGHDDKVVSVAFSPDGQRIVSASWDKTVRVWNADGTGESRILRGHDDWVSEAEFSPDGKYIVSASKDKTIRIWRTDGTGEPVILIGHGKWVNDARFGSDSQRIVSGSDDGTVRLWHDLSQPTLDDPRLWKATTYCMPVERRRELLGVSEEEAQRDHQRCLKRVE
jgi:WD40 repeat protein